MEKIIAEKICRMMEEHSGNLDKSVKILIDSGVSEAEIANYKEAVSKLMEIMWLDIMNPLYVEHPEIKPGHYP